MTSFPSTSRVREDFDRIAALTSTSGDPDYIDELLRHLPPSCDRALDVGCGTGVISRALAGRALRVDAIDLSPAMIELARKGGASNIRFIVGDIMAMKLGTSRYDVIASAAALHHVPLEEILPRLAAALKPGGLLLVVDLLEYKGIRELPRKIAAAIALRLRNMARGRPTREARRAWHEHWLNDHYDDWGTIQRTYERLVPGAELKRHLLWRYSAVWKKPDQRR